MAYCVPGDLLLEGLPLGKSGNNSAAILPKYIDAAADEIDILLSQVYIIPITYADIPANLATKKFLKQVNAWLATGRIIIAWNITSEDQQLNAYGRQLVNGALAALKDLVAGNGSLPGVAMSQQYQDQANKILSYQRDKVSMVESFEDVVFGAGFGAYQRYTYDPRVQ